MVRQKWWWWFPADGRAASWRELGGARPFVRACGVAICNAGRLFRGERQVCSASRAPQRMNADWESGALFKLCVRACRFADAGARSKI